GRAEGRRPRSACALPSAPPPARRRFRAGARCRATETTSAAASPPATPCTAAARDRRAGDPENAAPAAECLPCAHAAGEAEQESRSAGRRDLRETDPPRPYARGRC